MAGDSLEFGKQGGSGQADGRLDSSAFHRNHQPIWAVLQRYLGDLDGNVLELGSGSGQHMVYFASQSPRLTWWPSDLNPQHLASIDAWRAHARAGNVRPPLPIDLSSTAWWPAGAAPDQFDAIFCANVIHIAPWRVAEGLMAGAGRHLRTGGRLFLYGPFRRHGQHTAPSNAAFDASLRQSDPEWGVRDLDDVERLAAASGLGLREVVEMPANNLMPVFERSLM